MKADIGKDEWWPWYYCYFEETGEYDIPEDKVKWIRDTSEEYQRVQNYLKKLHGKED